MTCRSPQGNSSSSNNNRSACGDANVCRYGCVCGRHQSRAKLAGKRLRQSFLQLDGLKADAQLEAAVSTTTKSNVYVNNTSRAFTSTAGAAGAASGVAGAADGGADGADGAGAAGAAGAVDVVVKSAPNTPTLNGDFAADPAVRRKRRREDRYPQPQAQTQTHQNPQPNPPAERRSSTSGSTSGTSTNGASSARSFRGEGGPLIGVPTDQAAARVGRRASRRATPPAEEGLTGDVRDVRANPQARLETKVTPKVRANLHAIAVQANEQGKEQGNGNTEHLLLLSGASRNGTSSNHESSETSAPGPSYAAPAGVSGMEAAPLRRRRSSENVCVQPGFAVVGLVGTFGERVLLLPTEEGRRRLAAETAASATAAAATAANDDGDGSVAAAAAAAAAAASDEGEGCAACDAPATITWHDGKTKRRATLTSTKAKPSICNPIPALATVLSWARLLHLDTLRVPGADGTVGVSIPLLSERLGRGSPTPSPFPAVPTSKPDSDAGATAADAAAGAAGGGDGGDGDGDDDDVADNEKCDTDGDDAAASAGDNGDGDGGGAKRGPRRTLSIGAAWLLAHQVFSREARGVSSGNSWGGSVIPPGQVGVGGGEAAALRLLSCPDIVWAPDPESVMQALGEGGGSMRAYTVSPFEFDGSREKDERGQGREGEEQDKEDRQWGSEAQAACEELVRLGLCKKSPDGSSLGLHPDVDRLVELSLKVFGDKHGDSDKDILVYAALGLAKTGPITMGLRPPSIHAFLTSPKPSSTRGFEASPIIFGEGGGARNFAKDRMRGRVGRVCVQLHSWCLEVRRGVGSADRDGNLLWRLVKGAVAGDARSPRVWNGPMAEALGLLGGWRPEGAAAAAAAVVSGDDCVWMASLSKKQRLLEPTCLRLKEAAAEVLKVVEGLVAAWQKNKMYKEAVTLLRLVVRRDQDLAGVEYRTSPDLAWAADWCTSMWRGWAWNRLSVNYETHLKDREACLDALQSGRDDDCVRGGERVELRQRRAASHRKYGDSDDTPPTPQPRRDPEDEIVVDMETRKEGNKRGKKGGRILFFDKPGQERGGGVVPSGRGDRKGGLTVEEVVLRERHREGGWAGLHCECSLIMFLMVLLLWEEVFDVRATAAFPHCLTSAPLDLYDLHFCARRKGLPKRLKDIAGATDEQLWMDVGDRYERYKDVRSAWCNWRRFSKQQALEISVSFGGRTLSRVLRMLTTDLPHVHYGFPDLVLWKPRGRKGVSRRDRSGSNWRTGEFGLGWEGEGRGWEVQVVEVKSPSDTLSHVQKAWLRELHTAHVPAMVSRVTLKREGGARAQRARDK